VISGWIVLGLVVLVFTLILLVQWRAHRRLLGMRGSRQRPGPSSPLRGPGYPYDRESER
jgi:hypothetical protein